MISQLIGKNGKAVANQFVLNNSGETIFQSYDTIVAKKVETSNGVEIILDTKAFEYSTTTSKHLATFLGYNSAAEMKKDKDNFKFENLN